MNYIRLRAWALWIAAISGLCFLALALFLNIFSAPRDIRAELDPALARAEESPSLAWWYPLESDVFGGNALRRYPVDSPENTRASTLRVFVNGEPLGPPHIAHATIRSEGGGAYSHWQNTGLLFSLPEPGQEIETLSVEARSLQPAWVPPATLAAAIVGAGLLVFALFQVPAVYRAAGGIFDWLAPVSSSSDARRRHGALTAALGLAALFCLSAGLFLGANSRPMERGLDLDPSLARAEAEGSLAFHHPLALDALEAHFPFHVVPVDSVADPDASTLRLFVNGEETGPAHVSHEAIRATGGGAYSHWMGAGLLFSLPEGTGEVRSLAVMIVLRPVSWLPWAAIGLLIAGGALAGVTVRRAERLSRAVSPLGGFLSRRHLDIIRLGLGALAAVFALVALAGAASWIVPIETSQEIETEKAVLTGPDYGYTIAFERAIAPFVQVRASEDRYLSMSYSGGEPLLCDDGGAEISELGDGRCRLWSLNLWFSTPGNVPLEAAAPIRVHHRVVVHPYLIAAALILALIFGYGAIATRSTGDIVRGSGAVLATVGASLLIVNLAGFAVPLRPANMDEYVLRPNDFQYTVQEALEALDREPGESDLQYSQRAFELVSGTIGHNNGPLPLPVTENWLIHLSRFFDPTLEEYFFWDPERTLVRGLAQCGPATTTLVALLNEAGIQARVVGLNGHIVATAEVAPGQWYVFDADYHVAIPEPIETVSANPELVSQYYAPMMQNFGYENPDLELKKIQLFYSTRYGLSSVEDYFHSWRWGNLSHAEREALFYWLKWFIPLALLALGGALLLAGGANPLGVGRKSSDKSTA